MKERLIWVHLDEEGQAAVRLLTRDGRSRAAAIRGALIEAVKRSDRSVLAVEASAVAGDEADRREMVAVAAAMDSLRMSIM